MRLMVEQLEKLESRLRELAFLNKGLAIKLTDGRPGKEKEETYHYEGGVGEFVKYLNRTEETLHQPIHIEKVAGDVRVELGRRQDRVCGRVWMGSRMQSTSQGKLQDRS